jgi:hypothetical protein
MAPTRHRGRLNLPLNGAVDAGGTTARYSADVRRARAAPPCPAAKSGPQKRYARVSAIRSGRPSIVASDPASAPSKETLTASVSCAR